MSGRVRFHRTVILCKNQSQFDQLDTIEQGDAELIVVGREIRKSRWPLELSREILKELGRAAK